MSNALLELRGVTVAFGRRASEATPVLDGVDLDVREGEILGVIGETGSGKTTLARTAVGLTAPRSGHISFEGRRLTGLRGRGLREFRRTGRLQYAFQDPLRALDPDLTVRQSVAEPLAVAGGLDEAELTSRVDEALRTVGLDPALADRLPGGISGGQRQRALLARAVVTRPRLLIADEPVSALDASNRNRVLALLDRLRREQGMAIVIISHDLSSLAGIADRVAVLYRGRLVEQGPVRAVFERPLHPYTALLLASAPSVRTEHGPPVALLRPSGPAPQWAGAGVGTVGCGFAGRCPFMTDDCRTAPLPRQHAESPEDPGGGTREAACHHAPSWRERVRVREPVAASDGAPS